MQKDKKIYATVMDWPESGTTIIRSLEKSSPHYTEKIRQIRLVSTGEKLKFKQHSDTREVYFPNQKPEASYANALEILS